MQDIVVNGTWLVRYADGAETHQRDETHPQFQHGEVPFRAIEWDRVAAVRFESQFAAAEFGFAHPGPGWTVALRSRHFARIGASIGVFVLVTYPSDGTPQDAVDAFYWFPDGSYHSCHLFECRDVVSFAQAMLFGREERLALQHNAHDLVVDAVVGS